MPNIYLVVPEIYYSRTHNKEQRIYVMECYAILQTL